jgi:hypothetical protein
MKLFKRIACALGLAALLAGQVEASSLSPPNLPAATVIQPADLFLVWPNATSGPLEQVQWSVVESQMLTALGGGYLTPGNNLSDVASASISRSNLGLGSGITGTGSVVLSASPVLTGTPSLSNSGLSVFDISGGTTNFKELAFQTAGSTRWVTESDNVAESGSNAGSNYEIARFSDTGAFIDSPMVLSRATGASTFSATMTISQGAQADTLTLNQTAPGSHDLDLDYFNNGTADWVLRDAMNSGGSAFYLGNFRTGGTDWQCYISTDTCNFTNTPTTTTTAAGDNSTKVATTAWVQTQGMQAAPQQLISSNTTLGNSQAGAMLLVSGAITLTFGSGTQTYNIDNYGSQPVTLSYPTLSDFRTTLYPGEQVVLHGDGTGYWRVVAQNVRILSQNSQSANYTFAMSAPGLGLDDLGQQVYHPPSDTTARTWTIPANSSVAFPIGAKIDLINDCSAGAITITINTDTLVWFTSGSTGSRTLAACGEATLSKVGSTRWVITGVGLT